MIGLSDRAEEHVAEEVRELDEHAEEGRQDSSLAPVSLAMVIPAVLVAGATPLGRAPLALNGAA